MNIHIFGDQTADQLVLLRTILTRKGNALLTTFLERCSVALREETLRLPRSQQKNIPDFLTISHLVEAYHEKKLKIPQLESCFLTITQLSHFIGYYYENPLELPHLYNTRVIGLCTGLLAASAVACARSICELLPLAIEAVRISFRTGVVAGNVRRALDTEENADRPWSTIIPTTNKDAVNSILDRFHRANRIPLLKQAYISAISPMAVTISGPPATTNHLFQSAETLGANRVPIRVYAPYHAAHLFSKADEERILDIEIEKNLRFFRPGALVHSASTGKCHTVTNAFELFKTSVGEILMASVRWDNILEEAVSQITSEGLECSINAFGITSTLNSFVSALKAGSQSSIPISPSKASNQPAISLPSLRLSTQSSISISIMDHTSWKTPSQNFGNLRNDKIAIIGMSGRFPGPIGQSPGISGHEALWQVLEKGLDVHREIPPDRFDAKAHTDSSGKGKNKSHSPYGCFIEEPGLFDARFFNMSPREAAQTDPMGRLALVTAYEALEMSGYVPNRTPSTKLHRIGTFYGQTSDDWREINAAENIDTYFITGGVRAFAPGRINYYFKFSGPSFSIDTACSSSLAALQLACTSLWAGDCDTACAGGLNVLTNPDIFSGLSKGQFLSKTGGCKTYDNDADGYCRGDGCATVILKRYEDAIADNDNILGSILATRTNHSAEAVSITHPHAGAQEFLYKRVLSDAGVDAHDISYVEMHGTGTQAGDGIEMTSVTNTFAPRDRQRRPDQPLYLGAVKANIGHGEAASGINSLVKVLMMMQKNTIPANIGIKGVINENFPKDLAQRRVNIPTVNTPFPRGSKPRKIFLNNFSAAGGNTGILLEDGPLREASKTVDPRKTHLITVSACSIASLKRNIQRLHDWVQTNPVVSLPSLAYTSTARRIQHHYRVAFQVDKISNVCPALQAQLKDSYSPISTLMSTKIVFCFTGQGSQYAALGKKLYEDLPTFKADIDEFIRFAQLQGFPSFISLLDGTVEIENLSPVVVQMGMSCVQVALARMWSSWGVIPTAVIGHSLGEYAALHIAGVYSVSDMIFLVGRRAQLLERHCTKYTHGMVAVKSSLDIIKATLGEKINRVEIACINSPNETVLCSTIDVITNIDDILSSKGLRTTKLNVPFAFHSSQVEPILESFKTAAAAGITYNKPKIPILSPLTGDVIRDIGVIGPEYLASHARETVNFWKALSQGENENIFEKTATLEVGAHPLCLGMVKSSLRTQPIATAASLRRNEDPWKTLAGSLCALYLAGVSINFDEYHKSFNHSHELLPLPTMSFDEKRYWLDYHNNWCLTKGEASEPAKPKLIDEIKPKLSTTSCQRIVKEEVQVNTGTIVIQSNIAESKLHAAVSGHLVNEAPLCPSSLYADMAMTAADYLYRELRPGHHPSVGLNVCSMEVHKPLVAEIPPPPEGQHIQLEVSADLDQGTASLKFRSVKPDGSLIQDLGHGMVKYEDINDWLQDWTRVQYMVQTQVDLLRQKLQAGTAHKILRGIAYKLFKSFVDYSPPYRGMEEVILDEKESEATAKVRFQTNTERDGKFFCAPYWIDSLAHLSGFILNGSDIIDSSESVYISHGWSSIRIARALSAEKEYTSYVRMQPSPTNKTISVGDVYIFEGNEIIGVVNGLKFQNVPRRAFNIMVPPMKKKKSQATATPLPKKLSISVPKPVVSAPRLKISRALSATEALPVQIETPNASEATVATDSMVSRVIAIIAEETDLDISELVDEAAFENLGVDSLMSLTISAKFREDLNLEITSTLFTDYPTIGEMKRFFAHYDSGTPSTVSSGFAASGPDSFFSTPGTTPSTSGKQVSGWTESEYSSSEESSFRDQATFKNLGSPASNILDRVDFEDSPMTDGDFLQATADTKRRPTLPIIDDMLDMEKSFSIDNPFAEQSGEKKVKFTNTVRFPSLTTEPLPPKPEDLSEELALIHRDTSHLPPASSVLLQNSSRNATQKLFLLPDGSGSATSYVSIPNLSSNIKVYGLNCPFMKKPDGFTCSVEQVVGIYLTEIRRRQPRGPYMIGGWSAGGVLAYETARQLILANEEVDRLILLDAPCPVALDPLPTRLHIFFDQIGLLGTGKSGGTPGWLLPHFAASIKALSDYNPIPFQKGTAPRTVAIWCTDGVCKNPDDPRPPPAEEEDPAPMKWLLNNRTDFGDNGWAQLVDIDNMKFHVMGGNHFSMMKPPHSETLGRYIRMGLGCSDT